MRTPYAARVTKILRLEHGAPLPDGTPGALDLYLPTGTARLEVLAEPDATVQRCRDALRVAAGDWFLDDRVGVDSEILLGARGREPGPGYPLIPPEVEVRRVLEAVVGVRAVRDIALRGLRSEADAEEAGEDALALWRRVGGRAYLVTAVLLVDGGDLDLTAPVSLAPAAF